MRMTVRELYNLDEGFGALADKELPISTSLKISKNNRVIRDEIKSPDEIRNKLIEKYKEVEHDDGTIQIKKEHIGDYKREFDELLLQEVTVKLSKIKLSELSNIVVMPKTLGFINALLENDTDE